MLGTKSSRKLNWHRVPFGVDTLDPKGFWNYSDEHLQKQKPCKAVPMKVLPMPQRRFGRKQGFWFISGPLQSSTVNVSTSTTNQIIAYTDLVPEMSSKFINFYAVR